MMIILHIYAGMGNETPNLIRITSVIWISTNGAPSRTEGRTEFEMVMGMAIVKFYRIHRSIREELGEEMARQLFPEYTALPEQMPLPEQARLSKLIMDRMDRLLDRDTIARVRRKHCCNPSRQQIEEIHALKEQCGDLDEFCAEYSKFFAPGHVEREGDLLTLSFGWGKCVCGMFRNLESYERMSKTWCECCNGYVIKVFRMIFGQKVVSRIEEAVICGDRDCVFKVRI